MDERNLTHPELGLLTKSKAVCRSEADEEADRFAKSKEHRTLTYKAQM